MHLRAIQPQTDADVIDSKYRVMRDLATGGTANVVEARHAYTGWTVAVKIGKTGTKVLSQLGRRLVGEARALGGLDHPNIVRLIDAGNCAKKGPYVVLELLEGRPLDGILTARGTLTVGDTVQVARAVGKALEATHRAGIVHRDVKPANIFLATNARGTVFKLVDYGIARRIEAPADSRITEPGELLGTLDYMPPEQLASSSMVDPRSDQYALGVVLFECLTGNVPKLGNRLIGLPQETDALVARRDVPAVLTAAIQRMLSVEPESRFPDMTSALAAIGEIGAEEPKPVAQNGISRRRFARAPYTAPCRVVRTSGAPIDGRIEDISKGGLLVVLKAGPSADLPQFGGSGEEVSVRFALPTSGLVVTQRALVRWVKDARGRAAIGVEFVDLAPDTANAIDAYVKYMSPSVVQSA